MHYYKRNLGDYAKKAGRLSILQHGVYNLLIDACYDREQFPTEAEAIDWVWASTEQEIEAVKFVLRKFFVLENGVFVQTRIVEELAEYKKKAETNARIATVREQKRTNRAPVVHESSKKDNDASPNHKPITINQEPKEDDKKPIPSSFDEQTIENQKSGVRVSVWIRDEYKKLGVQPSVNSFDPRLAEIDELKIPEEIVRQVANECAQGGKPVVYALATIVNQHKEALERAARPKKEIIDWSDPNSLNILGSKLSCHPLPGETTQRFAARLKAVIADKQAQQDSKRLESALSA
jgi:uncharacterized protein YdaU (DUF1376 family)